MSGKKTSSSSATRGGGTIKKFRFHRTSPSSSNLNVDILGTESHTISPTTNIPTNSPTSQLEPRTQQPVIQPTQLSFDSTGENSQNQETPCNRSPIIQPNQETQGSHHETQEGSKKLKIFPNGKEFYPGHTDVIHALSHIIRSKYDAPYRTWKDIPIEVRNMWFDEFKKKFCWDDEHAHEIRKVFEYRGAYRLKGMTFEVRKTGKQPLWLSKEVYEKLCEYWNSPEFEEKREMAKTNRASTLGVGSSVHCGGSIPHSEHKRRLAEELQREPTLDEHFLRTHVKKDKSWVDEKAKAAHEKYKAKVMEISSSQGEGSTSQGTRPQLLSTETRLNIWKEAVGLTNKGKIYGFGMEGSCASLNGPSPNMNPSLKNTLAQHEKVKKSKKKLKKRLSRVEKQLDHTNQQLSETTSLLKTLMQQMNFPTSINPNNGGGVGVNGANVNGNDKECDDEHEDEDEDEDEEEDEDDDMEDV